MGHLLGDPLHQLLLLLTASPSLGSPPHMEIFPFENAVAGSAKFHTLFFFTAKFLSLTSLCLPVPQPVECGFSLSQLLCEGHCDLLVVTSRGSFHPDLISLVFVSLDHYPLSSCLLSQALSSLLCIPFFSGSHDLVSPLVGPIFIPLPFLLHMLGLGFASATTLGLNTSPMHTTTWSPNDRNPAQVSLSKMWDDF